MTSRQEAARKALERIKAQSAPPAQGATPPVAGKPKVIQNRTITNTEYSVIRKDKDFLYYPRRRSYKTSYF